MDSLNRGLELSQHVNKSQSDDLRQALVAGENFFVLLGRELVDRKAAAHVCKRNDDVDDDTDDIEQEREKDRRSKKNQDIGPPPPPRRPKPTAHALIAASYRGHFALPIEVAIQLSPRIPSFPALRSAAAKREPTPVKRRGAGERSPLSRAS